MKPKVVLAFSGGLDTSFCARFLAVDEGMEVHTVIVNTGGFTDADLQRIEDRAYACGAVTHTTIDAVQELYDRVLRWCIAGNVLKNGTYPLSVSAERIIQALAIARFARSVGATYVAHGSTGAGNDQVRFDLVFRIVCPELVVLTPIRDRTLSREESIAYLQKHGVTGDWTKAAYSINQGLWGTTVGGRETLTSHEYVPESAWGLASQKGQDLSPQTLHLDFYQGHPVAINGEAMSSVDVIRQLDGMASPYGIGRDIHVGDTIIGIKGRVAFQAAAALLTIKAHHALEKHALTKWQLQLKDQLALWYGQLLHEGQYLEPVMRDIEAFFASTQQTVSGRVHIELRDERFVILGVTSDNDLMKSDVATYGEENRAWTADDVRGYATIVSVSTRLHTALHGGAE